MIIIKIIILYFIQITHNDDVPLNGYSASQDDQQLTISVQACCAVTTEYGIPGDFVKTSTASLQIKISTAQVNFSNRKVIIF